MSFRFNFLSNEDCTTHENSQLPSTDTTSNLKPNKSEITSKLSFHELYSTQENSLKFPYDIIKISDTVSIRRIIQTNNNSHALYNQESDVIPGIYEGGLKVWECSIDLCKYLSQIQFKNTNRNQIILELGCGHALPSCFLISQYNHNLNYIVMDLNQQVLDKVTLINLRLNHSSNQINNKIAMISGHWNEQDTLCNLRETIAKFTLETSTTTNLKVDVILASETIYSRQHTIDTIMFILKYLNINDGTAYIATKRYYFGVGGGTNMFLDLAKELQHENLKLSVDVAHSIDQGMGNIRDILIAKIS